MQQANGTLIAHAGAQPIARADLINLPTPEPTETWRPVPHWELADAIEGQARRLGLKLQSEQYAVTPDAARLFGTVTVSEGWNGFAFALGFRAANDKRLAIQIVAGLSVFVCDNLVLSGDAITLKRKHTSGLDVVPEIAGGIARAVERFRPLRDRVERLQLAEIGDDHAKARILDAALRGIMPLRLVTDVAKAYFEPPHADFRPRTLWSLHNAFTEVFKGLRPNIAQQATIELGKAFGL